MTVKAVNRAEVHFTVCCKVLLVYNLSPAKGSPPLKQLLENICKGKDFTAGLKIANNTALKKVFYLVFTRVLFMN